MASGRASTLGSEFNWVPNRSGFSPLLARTQTIRRPIGPFAYDCVKVIVVRDGGAILVSDFGEQTVGQGDVVVLGTNVSCSSEPEGQIRVTTIYADSDFIVDQVFWQNVGYLQDRLHARQLASTIYSEPAQILRLGSNRFEMLLPWLDELVAHSSSEHFQDHFLRMQALWFQIAYVIAPFIRMTPVHLSPSQRAHTRPTLPRIRRFEPLRAEVRYAANLLRENPERRWTLEELATQVYLSPSRLSSVFVDAYGKTPLAFLTMIRAEQLATYLRETDLTVTAAMQRVGWNSRSHGTRLFREYVGLTPGDYRRLHARIA